MASGRYALKNMSTGEQESLTATKSPPSWRGLELIISNMETSVALDFLGELRRTHSCGELRAADAGKTSC